MLGRFTRLSLERKLPLAIGAVLLAVLGAIAAMSYVQVEPFFTTKEQGKGTRLGLAPCYGIVKQLGGLVVEDETAVRNVARRILKRQDYQVLEAASAEQALTLIQEYADPIHLLLTDVVLPGMGGRELAERVVAARPNTKVLFASGYTDDVMLQHKLVAHDAVLLQKPYTAESLALKVREVLDSTA